MRADVRATSPTRNLMRELLLVSWFLARRIPVSWFLAWRKCRQESIGCGKCDTQVVRQCHVTTSVTRAPATGQTLPMSGWRPSEPESLCGAILIGDSALN